MSSRAADVTWLEGSLHELRAYPSQRVAGVNLVHYAVAVASPSPAALIFECSSHFDPKALGFRQPSEEQILYRAFGSAPSRHRL